MSSGPTALDYVTLGIAATGAVTGIAALGATWAQFVLSGPRLKVQLSSAMGVSNTRWYVSVDVYNGGRAAATVQSLSLAIPQTDHHMPLGLAMQQGYAQGPGFPVRLEPYASETWLVAPEPFAATLLERGQQTHVKAFTVVNGKKVTSKNSVDLALVAKYNAE